MKAFEKLIYLASPYSHSDPKVQQLRFIQAAEATARLQDQGHLVFSPIVHSHYCVPFTEKQGGTFSDWEALDKAFIDRCDEVWILCLDGWVESKGVYAETLYAFQQGKPRRYLAFPSLEVTSEWGLLGPQDQADGFAGQTEGDYGVACCDLHDRVPGDHGDCRTEGDYNSEVEDVFGEKRFGQPMLRDPSNRKLAATCTVDKFIRENPPLGQPLDEFLEENPGCIGPATTIIGLTGHAQSGKDTAGKYLVENHGFVRIGLADAVKDCLYWLNPVVEWSQDKDGHELNFGDGQLKHFYLAQSETSLRQYTETRRLVDHFGWEKSKQLSHFRELLQRMGTEVGRNIISETVWLDIAHNKIAELGPEAKVVITDVRFPNEAEWVKALGGEVWEVIRPGTGPVNDHPSDQKLDSSLIIAQVVNDAEIEAFYMQLNRELANYNLNQTAQTA